MSVPLGSGGKGRRGAVDALGQPKCEAPGGEGGSRISHESAPRYDLTRQAPVQVQALPPQPLSVEEDRIDTFLGAAAWTFGALCGVGTVVGLWWLGGTPVVLLITAIAACRWIVRKRRVLQ